MSTGSTGLSSPTRGLPAHLVAIWTRDEWLSAPLALALGRLGYRCCTLRGASDLAGELASLGRAPVVLLLGPRVTPDEVEELIAPLDASRTVAGIWFTWQSGPLSAPPRYLPHRLPPDLRALDQAIRLLISAG